MEVVVTTGATRHAKLQSNHHHQQTSIQLFTGRMPFLSPNQQCQSSEEKESWNRFLCLVWFGLLLFNGTFSTNRLYRAIGV